MKFLKHLLVSCFALISLSSFAGPNDPLFVNLTAEDSHKAKMAVTFSLKQHELGHPVTIFLNDKAVAIGVKQNTAKYAEHQKMLNEIIAKGGKVIICPMCLKHYGYSEADIIPNIQISSPKITADALYKDNAKALSW